MKKSLVFTKSIAFEKTLIDKLEGYLGTADQEGKKVNFSAEVSSLIEAGLLYKQLEKDVLAGKRPQLGQDTLITAGKVKLHDLIKQKIEYGSTGLEQPKPVKGIRIQKI